MSTNKKSAKTPKGGDLRLQGYGFNPDDFDDFQAEFEAGPVQKPFTKARARDFLAEAMVHGGNSAIERMEKEGQRRLVASTQLPRKMGPAHRAAFEKMGIVFDKDPGKGLFVNATLPKGWALQRTNHSMWSELLDDKGRKRGSMFYKAAFYDEDAFIRPCGRFEFEHTDPAEKGEKYNRRHLYLGVKDLAKGGAIVFSSIRDMDDSLSEKDPNFWSTRDALEKENGAAIDTWFAVNYPNHKDPTAHWDDP